MSAVEGQHRSEDEPDAGAELALRVFTGDERWGWEFVQPPEPPAHRDAGNPPTYNEPSGHKVRAMEERAMAGKKSSGSGCLVFLLGGVAFITGGATAAVVVVVLVIAVLIASSPGTRLRAAWSMSFTPTPSVLRPLPSTRATGR